MTADPIKDYRVYVALLTEFVDMEQQAATVP